MFKGTVDCFISSKAGNNAYGEEIFYAPKKVRCSVIKLKSISFHTTVRVDSGATRGGAAELSADVVLLFPPKDAPKISDKVVVYGLTLTAVSSQPQFDVRGNIDHIRVECAEWADK